MSGFRRGKGKRRNRISMWGTTEEFNARVARREQVSPGQESRRLAKLKSPPDGRIIQLYRWVRSWNATHQDEPLEVDHIRPIAQGGLHVRENLRVIPKQKNRGEVVRTEAQIKMLLLINKATLEL